MSIAQRYNLAPEVISFIGEEFARQLAQATQAAASVRQDPQVPRAAPSTTAEPRPSTAEPPWSTSNPDAAVTVRTPAPDQVPYQRNRSILP